MFPYYILEFNYRTTTRNLPGGPRSITFPTFYAGQNQESQQEIYAAFLDKELADKLLLRYAHRNPKLIERSGYDVNLKVSFADVDEVEPVPALQNALKQALRELPREEVTKIIENQLKVQA